MKLEGMHHITMITGDATEERRVLRRRARAAAGQEDRQLRRARGLPPLLRRRAGLARLDPHLVRVRRRPPGPRGRGHDPHDPARRRLRGVAGLLGRPPRRQGLRRASAASGSLAFEDYDGLRFELVVADDGNPPLRAEHPEVPAEHAILGVEGARAYAARGLDADRELLTDTLGFTEVGDGEYRLDGDERHFHWGYDEPPAQRGLQGAGTVHHIAWHSRDEDHVAWQQRAAEAGMQRHARDRPRLLQLDLLPPAAGRPVRDRHDVAGLRRRRGPRAPRRGAAPADAARAPAPAARAPADAAEQPARRRRATRRSHERR